MRATARDRRHFEAIAEAKRLEHEDRLREAAAEPPMKKLIEGLELGAATPTTAAVEASLDDRARGQAGLHERARRLGLLR